jgi:hypothetical protein
MFESPFVDGLPESTIAPTHHDEAGVQSLRVFFRHAAIAGSLRLECVGSGPGTERLITRRDHMSKKSAPRTALRPLAVKRTLPTLSASQLQAVAGGAAVHGTISFSWFDPSSGDVVGDNE